MAEDDQGFTDGQVDKMTFPPSPPLWSTLARHLLAEGHDPKAILRVTRKGTVVFKDATLKAWSRMAVEEGDHTSARFRPYREWNADDLVGRIDQAEAEGLEGSDVWQTSGRLWKVPTVTAERGD